VNQTYHLILSDREMFLCEGCGNVIADRQRHDLWHEKTRSIL
jgi:hypothetical protein